MARRLELCFAAGLMALLPLLASAQEVITLEGARIRGGEEAPLVLYVVPWKPPEAKSLDQPDEQLMLAKPPEMLERAEFRRLMSYHQHFQSQNASGPEASENAENTQE